MKFVATKKGFTTNFFSHLSFVAVFGSEIGDPGFGMGKNQDPGSGIDILDPQHGCPGQLPRDPEHLAEHLREALHQPQPGADRPAGNCHHARRRNI